MTIRATWKDTVLAESDRTVIVEGNHYFPLEDTKTEYFSDSPTHSTCAWKGEASYHSVLVGGETNPDAVWYYPEPKAEAENIRNHVAFWHGVEIADTAS